MSLSEADVKKSLAELDVLVKDIQSLLDPMLGKPIQETLNDKDPLENAKLQISLAYAMNTLYFCNYLDASPSLFMFLLVYMRLQNANLTDHPILKDIVRAIFWTGLYF